MGGEQERKRFKIYVYLLISDFKQFFTALLMQMLKLGKKLPPLRGHSRHFFFLFCKWLRVFILIENLAVSKMLYSYQNHQRYEKSSSYLVLQIIQSSKMITKLNS